MRVIIFLFLNVLTLLKAGKCPGTVTRTYIGNHVSPVDADYFKCSAAKNKGKTISWTCDCDECKKLADCPAYSAGAINGGNHGVTVSHNDIAVRGYDSRGCDYKKTCPSSAHFAGYGDAYDQEERAKDQMVSPINQYYSIHNDKETSSKNDHDNGSGMDTNTLFMSIVILLVVIIACFACLFTGIIGIFIGRSMGNTSNNHKVPGIYHKMDQIDHSV